jgi:peptide-methionine (S)-S-oxide reductase
MLFSRAKLTLPAPDGALPGRQGYAFDLAATHAVLGTPLLGPWPIEMERAYFGLGCFWGAERIFWQTPGVHSTAVGYAGGVTPFPTYEEVCSGLTGQNEVVQVIFDPQNVSFTELAARFFESHDPTQGFRQGNDIGTQYRSGIYTVDQTQVEIAREVREIYGARLAQKGFGEITTEIVAFENFYYAEEYHQQYLHKVPNGYCGIGGTGISCPTNSLG